MSVPSLPKKVVGPFYGRSYDQAMPFYGQDANLTTSYSGQRLKQPVQSGLATFDDLRDPNGPWTWSKAHTLLGDREDRAKYAPNADPLYMEDRIPVMKGWQHLASAYALDNMAKDMAKLDPSKPIDLAKINALAQEIIKGKKHAYEEEFHDEFVHRFREFLRGNGSEREYYEAGMHSYTGANRRKGKPISDHPTVLGYLSEWQSRVIEFNKRRTIMKLRMGRQGPYGEAASLDDLWKYYKFVVYGVENDDGLDALIDAAIIDDRNQHNNVVQGPMGAAAIRPSVPAKDGVGPGVIVEPMPQTSDEQMRQTVILAPDPAMDAINSLTDEQLAAVAKAMPAIDLETRLNALKPKPPARPSSPDLEAKLNALKPTPKSSPVKEDPDEDADLEKRVKDLKKEPKPSPLPKLPSAPKTEPVPDAFEAEATARLERLKREYDDTREELKRERTAAEQRANQLQAEITRLKDHQSDISQVQQFFQRLLQQAQPAAPPVAVPPTAVLPDITPVPSIAAQPMAPAIQPASPNVVVTPPAIPRAPVVVPPTAALPDITPVAPLTVQPAAPIQPPQSPNVAIAAPAPAPAPAPTPPAPMPPAHPAPDRESGPVKRVKEEPVPPTRESKTNPASRLAQQAAEIGQNRKEAIPIQDAADAEMHRDLTAWSDMNKEYLAQLPAAIEAASKPDSTEQEKAKAEFLRRATETLATEIPKAYDDNSISADARQRVRDATHVPNVLKTVPSATPAPHLTIFDKVVPLRPGARVSIAGERVRTRSQSNKRSASPENHPASPKRSPPRADTPKPTPDPSPKRKVPDEKAKPITNKKKQPNKPEKNDKARGRKK